MTFNPGDVVMLKSGGLPLTIATVSDENVTCVWMSDDGVLFHDTLNAAVLDLLEIDLSEDDEDEEEEEDED